MSHSKPEELWAFVDDGGLVCAVMPGVGVVPLVSNRRDVVLRAMAPAAQLHAHTHCRPVSLVRYTLRNVEFILEPGPAG